MSKSKMEATKKPVALVNQAVRDAIQAERNARLENLNQFFVEKSEDFWLIDAARYLQRRSVEMTIEALVGNPIDPDRPELGTISHSDIEGAVWGALLDRDLDMDVY